MPYRKKHIKNKIYKIKPKKSILKKMWFWLLILFAVLVLSISYFILFYPKFQVKNIVISGNEKVNAQDLQKLVLENINTGLVKFWNIDVSSKSIFLVNTDKLNKEILRKLPIIEKLQINRKLPETVLLGIEERKPVGIFCPPSGENNCFLVDQNGIIYELLTAVPSNIIIVRQAGNNNPLSAGEKALAQNISDAISKIQKNLKDNFQIDLREAFVTSPIRLNITTKENWQIYFDVSSSADIDLQITKLNLLLKNEISKDDIKNLRYIDLRPKDRAIICDNSACGK